MPRIAHILCLALALGILCPDTALAGPRIHPSGQRQVKKKSVRRWVVKKTLQVRRKLRVEKRLKQAKVRFKKTRLGKRVARVTKKTRRLVRATRGQLTFLADGIEGRLPQGSRRARAFRKLRDYSPMAVPACSYHKFKQDPVFLGGYKGFSWTFAKVAPAVMLKVGAGVSASLVVPAIIGNVMDLTMIFGREHQLRKRLNPEQTLRQTAKGLGKDYRGFVENRRQQNRRYHKAYTQRMFKRADR